MALSTPWLLAWAVAGCSCGEPAHSDGALSDGPGAEAQLPTPDLRPDTVAPPDAAPPLTVSAVKVEPNPRSVLSCFVSWTTSEAATSAVERWEPGAGQGSRVGLPGLRTAHRVLVFGMHAQTGYTLQAVSSAGARRARSAELSFTTGKLPAHVPTAALVRHDRRRAFAG